jgi:nicotinamidase-related amidase
MRAGQDHLRPNQKTALLVVDLQQALCDAAPPVAMKLATTQITELLGWAEAHNWAIVFVQHWTEPNTILDRGSAGWQLAHALRGREPTFHLEKNVLSSFADERLHAWLETNGISRLCITGMQSEYCISAACKGASGLGYEVILPIDAHMTIDGPEKSAAQIVAETNDHLSAVARCLPTAALMAECN